MLKIGDAKSLEKGNEEDYTGWAIYRTLDGRQLCSILINFVYVVLLNRL